MNLITTTGTQTNPYSISARAFPTPPHTSRQTLEDITIVIPRVDPCKISGPNTRE